MKLKDYMKTEGLTERKMADSFGVSQQYINYIVRGKRNPSLEMARIIEEKTGGVVTTEDLFNPNIPSRLSMRKRNKKVEKTKT